MGVIRRNKPKIIAIVGQTATGKSDLAVYLAKKFNGEVVSADSRQVYRGLDIGTGKITKEEMQSIKHYLLDVASPKRVFDVVQFQKKAHKAIKEILKKGKIPIICGGTGLYIDAVTKNIQFPKTKKDWNLRKKLDTKSTDELFEILKKLDPKMLTCKDKKVVQYHQLFNYFLRRYNYKVYGTIEPLPGIAPSSKHTVALINIMKDNGVKKILQDVYHERKTAQFIAEKTGAKVLIIPHDLGADGSKTLQEFYNNIANRICQ